MTGVPEEHLHDQPILVGPYREPDRHWRTVGDSTHDEVVPGRRAADAPLPMGVHGPVQGDLDLHGIDGKGGKAIDRLRHELREWRAGGWKGTTHATRELLEYWSREPGEGPLHSLFYAQREAVETVVYLTEVGNGSHWMVKHLKRLADGWSRGLLRVALRMATGTGKTTVMACLIAWYAVNRRREHRASAGSLARNVDRVVVICPGRTIRDRLRGLDPRTKASIYDEWRLVPASLQRRLGGFRVDVINWERLQPRNGLDYADIDAKGGGGRLSYTKAMDLAGAGTDADSAESPDEMWSRLLGRVRPGRKERIVVLNDEGHHCWERRDGERPGIWMEALHALAGHRHYDVSQVVDLSATPIFINPGKTRRPEGMKEGLSTDQVVPWVISEFALMEAMESGLVKIPQPPRGSGAAAESPLRNLFDANGKRTLDTTDSMKMVRDGIALLYKDYEDTFNTWKSANDPRVGHPVFIVVANNKRNARALFEILGGRLGADGVTERSDFKLLSNVPHVGADPSECLMRTILVLSRSNSPEKDEGDQVKGGALGLREVGDRKSDGRTATEDELREVLQSVARPEGRGAEVRCVVSVGMLTEGWDCQRVTHILGYRAFGSQLLCEQTMGRALRRRDYDNLENVRRRDDGRVERRFPAEYATVFGVPFVRQSAEGEPKQPMPPEPKTEVHAIGSRVADHRIWVPDFKYYTATPAGFQVTLASDRVVEAWPVAGQEQGDITKVDTQGPIGPGKTIEAEPAIRPDKGVWLLAAELVRLLGDRLEAEGEAESAGRWRRGVLFSHCLRAVREWLQHGRIAFLPNDLESEGMRDLARDSILKALDLDDGPVRRIGVPSDPRSELRSAGDWRPFLTSLREVVKVERSELNVAACHSKLETEIARALDTSGLVAAFVRNHGPERFEIPYRYKGGWARYVPDFFVRCDPLPDGRVPHIVLEGKGVPDERSEHKAWWTDRWWLPCADRAGVAHRQVWTRRELSARCDVGAAIQSAIREAANR